MYVVIVAPLTRGIPYEELTYFSKDEISPGDLVEIFVKKRACNALVLFVNKAEEERQSLRHASFDLKRISKVKTKNFLPMKLWESLSFSSSCLIKPLGTIMYDLLSERTFDSLIPLQLPIERKGFEIQLLEQSHEVRMTRYKTAIRELFSKKKSIVMFFPTITDLEYAKEELSRGIDTYVVALHSGLTEKQYKEAQKEIQKNTHSLLILSTPSLLPWTRDDIGLIVLEREHSHYYFTHGDLGYDMRFVIEALARSSGIPCLFGSHMLSLYAHMRYKKKDAFETIPLHYRNDTNLKIVEMLDENKTASPYLSKIALAMLRELKHEGRGHYFLYAHRKGMYPTTVCSDCGTLFTCNTCGRPYVLHKINNVRTYVCHGCESVFHLEKDTTLACKHCGSWRMALLGIATSGVEEELKRLHIPTFVIDSEHTTTRTKAKKTYKEWLDSEYGVLIGTEMAQNSIRKCDGIIILSLDSLFSLPEYATDEKILNLVTEMAEKVTTNRDIDDTRFILQTRLHDMPVFKQLTSSSFREVFETLLKEREQLLLPPYYVVIKARFTSIDEAMKKHIEREIEPYTFEWFEQGGGTSLLFIHIKENEWLTHNDLRERIKRVVYGNEPVVNPLHFFI